MIYQVSFTKREGDDKIPDNCKYPLTTIEDARIQKQRNIQCLTKLLKLKVCGNVILTVNYLINSQTGNISLDEFAQGSVWKIYVKFLDEITGFKAMRLLCTRSS